MGCLLILLTIFVVIALIIGFLILFTLICTGVAGGIIIFLVGDLLIGIALVVLLIKKIATRKK